MAKNVFVDAGFLVALLSRRDEHHEWAASLAAGVTESLLTCEAVLAETAGQELAIIERELPGNVEQVAGEHEPHGAAAPSRGLTSRGDP